MNPRPRKLVQVASLSAGALALLAFAAPEASSVRARSTADLPPAGLASGTYQTIQTYAGRTYRSTWRLRVTPGISKWLVTGISEWDCCPGRRLDPLRGTIGEGGTVEISRDCTGQGSPEPCKQVFRGYFSEKTVRGTWSGNGRSGTWTLYANRLDVKFSVRAGHGEMNVKERLGPTDALILGGGQVKDLDRDYGDPTATVLAVRLAYSERDDVRISLRFLPAKRRVKIIFGKYTKTKRDETLLLQGLVVFQSSGNFITPGCPRVGRTEADLVLKKAAGGDTARVKICGITISWDPAAVTFTQFRS
jgi:hypothetical protein